MKTVSGEEKKPALTSERKLWKSDKFAKVFSNLKKNVFSKFQKFSHILPDNPSEVEKSSVYPAAVEIGTSSIKLIQLGKAAQGVEILKIAYLALADKQGSSKNLLASLINDNQIKGKIITTLALGKLQVFSFVFPNMPEPEIRQAVTWKLKQNLPAGMDMGTVSFDYDWSAVSADGANKEIHAVVFVTPKETVLEKIRLFRELSLKVAAVEPEPYAVFNALVFSKKISPEETVLILSLGAGESSIAVVCGGRISLLRPLNISGRGLTEAVANFHKFDAAKAEQVKKSEGLQGQGSGGAGESLCMPAVSSQLEGLIVDLEHTFKFFSHQLMKSRVSSYERVFLCGGSAALKNLDKFLAAKLGVPVEAFDPLSALNFTSAQNLSAEIKENALSFAAVTGMAARYLK